MSQVCAKLPRQCLHLQLWEHTLSVPLFIMDKHKMERRFMGHLTTTSILTMTVLLEVLVRWSEEFDLPPILYLQFDNSVRENKNCYMFALLALLVEDKIFRNYLILGNFKRNAFASFTLPTRYFVQASKCHIAMFSSSIWVGS